MKDKQGAQESKRNKPENNGSLEEMAQATWERWWRREEVWVCEWILKLQEPDSHLHGRIKIEGFQGRKGQNEVLHMRAKKRNVTADMVTKAR